MRTKQRREKKNKHMKKPDRIITTLNCTCFGIAQKINHVQSIEAKSIEWRKTRTKMNGKAHYWCRIHKRSKRKKKKTPNTENDKTNLYFICQIKFPIFFESTLRIAKHFQFSRSPLTLFNFCIRFLLSSVEVATILHEASTQIINMIQFKLARNVRRGRKKQQPATTSTNILFAKLRTETTSNLTIQANARCIVKLSNSMNERTNKRDTRNMLFIVLSCVCVCISKWK